jgi:two-component system cell cycle response regulator
MKALIVDSSKAYRQVLRKILELHGYAVFEAMNRIESLALLDEQGEFNLICLSVTLPDSTGFALCREIQSHSSQVKFPVFIFTATANRNLRASAIAAGAVELFYKNDVVQFDSYIAKFLQKNHSLGEILYVEDSPSQAAIIIAILATENYTVDHFSNVETAIKAYDNKAYDLVITDYVLEGEASGLDLVKYIRSHEKSLNRIPVLAMSNYSNPDRKIQLFNAGLNDYVDKPVIAEELLARAGNLIENYQLMNRLTLQGERLEQLAMHDQLTGLYNRHYLIENVSQRISQSIREGMALALVVIDIDHFKSVNDTRGHAVGDMVLVAVAGLLNEQCRHEDLVARYGGEEFVIVMNCTLEAASVKAEQLRVAMAELHPHDIELTASFGVTALHPEERDFDQFFVRADEAVYKAKHSGRNRVVVLN